MSLEYEGEKSATQSHPIDFQVHIGGIALQERVKIPFSDHTCEFLSSLVRAFLTKWVLTAKGTLCLFTFPISDQKWRQMFFGEKWKQFPPNTCSSKVAIEVIWFLSQKYEKKLIPAFDLKTKISERLKKKWDWRWSPTAHWG